jgi:hypothetical protein
MASWGVGAWSQAHVAFSRVGLACSVIVVAAAALHYASHGTFLTCAERLGPSSEDAHVDELRRRSAS